MKLLIVEDSAEMRGLIKQALAGVVDEFAECEDGDEAVAAYAAHGLTSEDRVLMDLRMQRVGGLEATRRIRAAYPDARVVVVTQYDDAHWRAAAARAGACGYVLKENLLELRRLLEAPP
jgi:CheY-like chemotaxis protein